MLTALTATLLGAGAATASAFIPNDTYFPRQWADANTGQPIPIEEEPETFGKAEPGTPGDDDRAAPAWKVSTGSRSIVIGEADTGVDYTHPDLAANVWTNPGGIGGCKAGTHGYNVLAKTCEAMDTEPLSYGEGHFGGHGTHVAGIMAAVGNNSRGVAGVEWQATVLPVKWLAAADEDPGVGKLIEALRWFAKVAREGVDVRVVNDSPTFEGKPSPEQIAEETEAIGELAAENILFVTAAGNTGEDDDLETGRYPCRLNLPNELCVTASNDEDQLPAWADYGAHTVDLAAPGVSIYSTLRGGEYGYLSGGSMAAAQVSGAAALILSAEPSLSPEALKGDILDNVEELPSLTGKVRTGGRLDVCKAMPGCEPVTVTGVSPSSGPTTGGTSVTIAGAHLDDASAVDFGSTAATHFEVVSPSEVVATSPPGVGTVDVTVTTIDGTSAPVGGDRFTYVAEPTGAPGGPTTGATGGTGTQSAPAQGNTGTTAVLGSSLSGGAVVLVSKTLKVTHGRAAVALRCAGATACAGRLAIAVRQATRQPGGATKSKLVTIGHVSFSVAAGRTTSIAVALSASGRALLRSAHGRLAGLLGIAGAPAVPGAAVAATQAIGVHLLATGHAKQSAS